MYSAVFFLFSVCFLFSILLAYFLVIIIVVVIFFFLGFYVVVVLHLPTAKQVQFPSGGCLQLVATIVVVVVVIPVAALFIQFHANSNFFTFFAYIPVKIYEGDWEIK